MELTPEVLHEQEFREARRGYDIREVDEFLERVAVAVAQLLEQHASALADADRSREQIERMEADAKNARPTTDEESKETLRRTLMLAQKTADAAIAEAEAQAADAVRRAEQQASFVLREADEKAERTRIEAESRARRSGEETRRRMLDEIITLERTRESLSGDVRSLRRFLDHQRTRMRTAARDLQRLVDDPTALKEFSPPSTSDASSADLDLDFLQDDEAAEGAAPADGAGGEESDEIDSWLATGADWAADASPASADDDAAADDAATPTAGGTEATVSPSDDEDADYFDDLRRAMDDADAPSDSPNP